MELLRVGIETLPHSALNGAGNGVIGHDTRHKRGSLTMETFPV